MILSINKSLNIETEWWQQHRYRVASILTFKIKQAQHHLNQLEEKIMQSTCLQDRLKRLKYLEMNIMLKKMIYKKELPLHLLAIQERLECSLLVMVKVKLRILSNKILSYKTQSTNLKYKAKLQFQLQIMKDNNFQD
jgi:hypothetical protein